MKSITAEIKYGALDVSRYFDGRYWYQVMAGNAQNYDYFHFNAPDFSSDIHIGFSSGFTGHDDSKWEIVLGGWGGKKHVIRERSQPKVVLNLAEKRNQNRFVLQRNEFTAEYKLLKNIWSLFKISLARKSGVGFRASQ